MAGNTRFHSKHHSEQHHSAKTRAISEFPDAATDPLGGPDAPYQGYLYINGNLNVSNKLKLDPEYPNFQINLPAAEYNIFEDALLINDSLSATGDAFIHGNLHVKKNLYVDQNVYLSGGDGGVLNFGDAMLDQIRFNAHVGSDVIPTVNHTHHLGTTAKRWAALYTKDIHLDGKMSLMNNQSCTFVVDVDQSYVAIGSCTNPDPANKLYVLGGNARFDTTMHVDQQATFQSDVVSHGDVHLDQGNKIHFTPLSANNYYTVQNEQVVIHSDQSVNNIAPVLDLDTPVIDTTSQSTWWKLTELHAGAASSTSDCLLHMQSTIGRIAIGTSNPMHPVHLHGGVTTTGASLDVLSDNLLVNNNHVSIVTDTVSMNTTGDTHITGNAVHVTASHNSPDAISLTAPFVQVNSSGALDINAPVIDLSDQKTQLWLKSSSAAAFTVDTNLFVIDTLNTRVGVNKQEPQATLHVGGTAIFDDQVNITGPVIVDNDDFTVVSDNDITLSAERVNIDASVHVGITTPVVDLDSPVIDLTTQSTTVNIGATVASLNFVSIPAVDAASSESIDVDDQTFVVNQLNVDLNRPHVSTSTTSGTVLSIDGANNRVGVMTNNPDKTITVHGEVSVTGELTELISTMVDVDSTVTSVQATDSLDIDTPSIKMLKDTNVQLAAGTRALTFDTDTLTIDSFNNRVGVNTLDPSADLDIHGDVVAQGAQLTTTYDDVNHTANQRYVVHAPVIDHTWPHGVTSLAGDLVIGTSNATARPTGRNTQLQIEQHDPSDPHATENGISLATSGVINGTTRLHNQNRNTRLDNQDHVPNDMTSGNLLLATGGTDHVRIDPQGRVLIGSINDTSTSLPDVVLEDYELTVLGSVKFDDMALDQLILTSLTPNRIVYRSPDTQQLITSDSLYCDGASGQVGINTITPDAASSLHVHDGDLRLTQNGTTTVLTTNRELSSAPIDAFTTTGTTMEGGVGDHLVFDLRNNNIGDSIAFRHAQFNNGIVDTVGFVYRPNGAAAGVGINVTTGQLADNALVVGGNTHIQGNLQVDGDFLIQGAQAQLEIQNLEITDKNVVVNKGGTTSQAFNSGLLIYGGAIAGDDDEVGYFKVHEVDNSLLVTKAPTGHELTLDIDADVSLYMDHKLQVTGDSIVNQDVSTTGAVIHDRIQLTSRMINNIDVELMRSDLTQVMNDRLTTQLELDTTQIGAGLSVAGDYVKNTDAHYISDAISLNHADVTLDQALKTEELSRLQSDSDMQFELDTTQTASGLQSDGQYIINNQASFINTSTSLAHADDILDTNLRTIEDIVGHGRSPATNNHRTRLDNHDLADQALNTRVDNTNTNLQLLTDDLNDRLDSDIVKNRLTRTNEQQQVTNTDLIGWVSGTNNQVDVTDDGSGGIVLSLPQGEFVSDSNITVGGIKLTDDAVTSMRLTYIDSNDELQTVEDLTNWVSGTDNQITINNDTDGTITLSLEQDIHVDATPTFSNLLLTEQTPNKFLMTNTSGLVQSVALTDWIKTGDGLDIAPDGTADTGVLISHQDTSAQDSHVNSNTQDRELTFRKVIQDVELDEFGHVVGLKTADVSYAVDNTTSPSLVPIQPPVNQARQFLNGNLEWVVYPNLGEKVSTAHQSLHINPNISEDTLNLDIDNTLIIGSTLDSETSLPNGQGSGSIHVIGSNTDTNYDVFKASRKRPRVQLTDTSINGKVFNIWNNAGELRIGTGADSTKTSAISIGPGDTGNIALNGQLIGREAEYLQGSSAGKSFLGNLEGNADTSSKFDQTKTIVFNGDVSGSVATDFADNVNVTLTVNDVDLGTDTTGQFLTHVVAGTNIQVTAHDGDDGGEQTISTTSDPEFNTVQATEFNTASDARLKTNIRNIDSSLEVINQLQGVSFDWKESNETKIGMIADDVEKIIPLAVKKTSDGLRAIDYNAVIAHLVEAVKTLSSKVNQL